MCLYVVGTCDGALSHIMLIFCRLGAGPSRFPPSGHVSIPSSPVVRHSKPSGLCNFFSSFKKGTKQAYRYSETVLTSPVGAIHAPPTVGRPRPRIRFSPSLVLFCKTRISVSCMLCCDVCADRMPNVLSVPFNLSMVCDLM